MKALTEEFIAALQTCYGASRTADWQAEKAPLTGLLESIFAEISNRYLPLTPLGVGGAGVTIKLKDKELSELSSTGDTSKELYAVLKVARPHVSGEPSLLLRREAERLALVRHQNIIRMLSGGTTQAGDPYYIMEYLPGVQDSHKWLIRPNGSPSDLINVLSCAARGVEQMHKVDLRHLDLKPENIFVAGTGEVVVADFGFTKLVGSNSCETTNFGGTAGYKHPEYEELLKSLGSSLVNREDPNREIVSAFKIDSKKLQKSFDIYSLGLTFLVLLRAAKAAHGPHFPRYTERYLKLLAHRMLDGKLRYAAVESDQILKVLHSATWWPLSDETPLVSDDVSGFTEKTISEVSYESIEEVIYDLEKLKSRDAVFDAVPELSHSPSEVIQASSHGPVSFTSRVREVLDTPEMRELGKVDQLGLIRLVYPNATHSRLEHSLGTFHLAARYARALYEDPVSPVFRQLMSSEDLKLLLVCALVHDVGHYPTAHDLEEVHAGFSHEARAVALLKENNPLSRALQAQVADDGRPGWSVDPGAVIRIIKGGPRLSFREGLIRSIISGPIDCDKLDYLTRDSENLRLPYGSGIDVGKLLQTLTVLVDTKGNRASGRLGILEKGLIPAESLAFARYAMFGSVYWHRTHRALKAMLARLALEALATASDRGGPAVAVRGAGVEPTNEEVEIFVRDLISEVAGPQQTLPIDEISADWYSPYLDRTTTATVGALARAAGPHVYDLANCLLKRKPYARVLVWSDEDSGRHGDALLGKMKLTFGRIHERRSFFNECEKRVVNFVLESCPGEEGLLTLLRQGVPLLLFDLPPYKPGSTSALSFLREREQKGSGVTSLSIQTVTKSSLWGNLAKEQENSLATLRVFAHAELAKHIGGIVSREEFVDLLLEAFESFQSQ